MSGGNLFCIDEGHYFNSLRTFLYLSMLDHTAVMLLPNNKSLCLFWSNFWPQKFVSVCLIAKVKKHFILMMMIFHFNSMLLHSMGSLLNFCINVSFVSGLCGNCVEVLS